MPWLSVLRMERAGAELHFSGDDGVELQDRDAVAVLALVVLLSDRLLDQVEAVDGGVRIQLARHRDVVALRRDVDAVRAARLGRQVQDPFRHCRLERDDADAVDLGELAGVDDLLGPLPVDDVQIVEIELRRADLDRRLALLDAAGGHLDVVGVDEGIALTHALAGVSEILGVGRQLDLETLGEVHPAALRVHAHEGRVAAVDVGIAIQVIVERCGLALAGVPRLERRHLR